MRTSMRPGGPVVLLVALAAAVPAAAEVLGASADALSTRSEVTIAAPPARVYEQLLQVGRWWSDEHTYSGAARNMRLEARPGGCWCETLADGGFIEHGRIVHAAPARTLRVVAALGPVHELGGSGSLTVQLVPEGSGTKATLTYVATGFEPKNGLDALAPLVDSVLAGQLRRLKGFIETGKAPAAPPAAARP